MKNVLFIVCAGLLFAACSKDKFTTAPQIKMVNVTPNFFSSEFNLVTYKPYAPKLILEVTDAEGDFGSNDISDSSMIYVKNLLTNELDSTRFPDLTTAPKKDFSAEVEVNLFSFLGCVDPGPPTPRIDTTYFEVYITDAKKNKSNVITTTGRPVFYECK